MAKYYEVLSSIEEKREYLQAIVHSLDKKKEMPSMLQRVAPEVTGRQFLKLFRIDGTVFGRIYKYVKKIVGPGFTFIPDPDVPDELKQTAIQEANELNKWKVKMGLDRLLRIIVKDIFLYGRGFIELCKNGLENDIIFLHTIDPLYMDYQRDEMNKVLLDEIGRPVGYVYEEGMYKVEFKRDEVAHFKFFEHSEVDLGITPLEPLYNVIVSKANFEKAAGEVLFRKGFPMWVLYIGDQAHEPPAGALEEAEKEFKELDRVTEMILPYYYKLDKIEASKMEELADYHNMFKSVIHEGFLSTPKPKARRRLVEVTDVEEEEIVKCFQVELADQIIEQIVSVLCNLRGYKTKPRVSFYEIKPATQLTFTRMMGVLFRYGALTHDIDTENYIRRELRIPLKRTGILEGKSMDNTKRIE